MKKALLVLTALGAAALANAQIPELEGTAKQLPYLTTQLLRQSIREGARHPVLGLLPKGTGPIMPTRLYAISTPSPDFFTFSEWNYSGAEAIHHLKIQWKPILTESSFADLADDSFVAIDDLTPAQLASALRMWFSAHPNGNLKDSPHTTALYNMADLACYLSTQTQPLSEISDPRRVKEIQNVRNNLPSIKLIQHMITPGFKLKNYMELAALAEKSGFPMPIVLTSDYFPKPSDLANQADFLNTLLFLSPDEVSSTEMAPYINTATEFQKLPLTPEEEEGAKNLALQHHKAYTLPDNATPREVLEGVYNRLASLLLPYETSGRASNPFQWDYLNSDIYPVVQKTLKRYKPTILQQNGKASLGNPEETHLFVLDGLMKQGKDDLAHDDWYAVRVITAFKYLCAQYSNNPENLPHLETMLNALQNRLGARALTYVDEGGGDGLPDIDDFLHGIPTSSMAKTKYIRSFTF